MEKIHQYYAAHEFGEETPHIGFPLFKSMHDNKCTLDKVSFKTRKFLRKQHFQTEYRYDVHKTSIVYDRLCKKLEEKQKTHYFSK